MALTPGNPVVGGEFLRRAAIESPNYVPATSGWSINQDGSAEFNSVTLRGVLNEPDPAGIAINLGNLLFLAPSGDITGATDRANFNNALSHFHPIILLPGTYFVNGTVFYSGGAFIDGLAWQQTTIKLVNGVNADAVLAPIGWSTGFVGRTGSLSPVIIKNLTIDANSANQTGGAGHCLVNQSFRGDFDHLVLQNSLGAGLLFDSAGFPLNTTAVENRIYKCRFNNNTGDGFRANDNNSTGPIYTDGFLTDCIFQAQSGDAIDIGNGAGWLINGNHLYGLQQNGIIVRRPFVTRITHNYIDGSWGKTATAGTYLGIDCGYTSFIADNGNGSIIDNNIVALRTPNPGNASSIIDGIGVRCSSSGTAHVTITGNIVSNISGITPASNGIIVSNQAAGAVFTVASTGNQINGTWGTAYAQNANGGTLTVTAGV